MIGENLKKVREIRGLSLSELAEKAGISKSYLSNMERNLNENPSIQVLDKISKALQVDIQTLVGVKTSGNVELDIEWMDFIDELRELRIEKEKIKELRPIIEFLKWRQEVSSNDGELD
ncbi:helix-turn-helix transcriptional regulator [Ornithinibacillus sp. BX22]|uniref:Helix-turn-helix transcriptional regulator n=2 Tax=Ornithinibacillus TaxID=484508 RepID=A0A923RJH3_9BACI|nr:MULTISPECIES: helix-turn-helix transcriptional regulator [Ornithinibacillus]MBC5638000.1 helix-turn-helix transcriptional regulator [Ornithinibacillus hominis]MBS3681888.1 helix-turn-helix transcriptional regulator [Ornithinibacillus massiliensis]